MYMKTILLPYGKEHLPLEIEESHLAGVLQSGIRLYSPGKSADDIVRESIENPIGSPRLREMAAGKRRITVIASDHTRPVPSRVIMPHMLAEIRAGNPSAEITILVATGLHRTTTREELAAKFGEEIVSKERIVIHDCDDDANLVHLGKLPSGGDLVVNRLAVDADLLVAEGFIEPHFFAGFSGGRKSVLPGICDQVTVMGNHCSKFIDSINSRTGKLDGNPMHADMVAAAQMAKLAFIVNVVIDENKKTVAAFAGDLVKAHRKGCDFLMDYARVAPKYADIVITSNGGAPLDQNVYQCAKSISAAEATCNPGGVIIECAECLDGHGAVSMYDELHNCKSTRELYDYIMTVPADKTTPDQWETQIYCRILNNFTVIFVTRPELKGMIEDMKMKHANTLDEALEMARAMGKESITVIPNGISVIVAE